MQFVSVRWFGAVYLGEGQRQRSAYDTSQPRRSGKTKVNEDEDLAEASDLALELDEASFG